VYCLISICLFAPKEDEWVNLIGWCPLLLLNYEVLPRTKIVWWLPSHAPQGRRLGLQTNEDLQMTWKEAVVSHSSIGICLERLRKTIETSAVIASITALIRIQHFPNRSLVRYRESRQLGKNPSNYCKTKNVPAANEGALGNAVWICNHVIKVNLSL
jgi:hypothetical protein